MASRYSDCRPIERCLSPLMVVKNGVSYRVPCGRCAACLLDRANNWSMRLVNEIDYQPFTIFCTFTYNNKYLPKLYYDGTINSYTSDNCYNIRSNGSFDVRRKDNIILSYPCKLDLPLIQNSRLDGAYVAYSSKLDFQLYLKKLRKLLYEKFNEYDLIRYYAISEYGPTTFRPHIHALFFCQRSDVAQFLVSDALYSCWKMCDKTLFDEYTKIADSGTAGYVTNYVTNVSYLKPFFKEREIKPFRLSSKNPAIGFSSFTEEKIFEDVIVGTIEYIKSVSRLQDDYVLRYPSNYVRRLLPKCREFSLLSYERLRYVYGFIYRNVIRKGFDYETVCRFVRDRWFPPDYTAAKKMFESYLNYGYDVDTYLFVLDKYYYLEQMSALKNFYEWQEEHSREPVTIAKSYINFSENVLSFSHLNPHWQFVMKCFCDSFGFDIYSFVHGVSPDDLIFDSSELDNFRIDVENIIDESVKLPKFYESNGLSPHIV